MAKLYFRYGTMDSAKSLNLLAVAHNYRKQGKRVALLKPALDDRFGRDKIRSRAGIEQDVDMLLEADSRIDPTKFEGIDCVLVDESQFLSPFVVDQLRALTRAPDVPVICYGLRTDFRTKLFPGSKRLLEVADRIEEVKVTCQFCNRKAIFNMRSVDGTPTLEGEQVMLGAEESYAPICYGCFSDRVTFGDISRPPKEAPE